MANKRVYSQSFAQRDDFQIAILCALSLEAAFVEKLFDEVYETKSLLWQKSNGDSNCYTTGKIGNHHVVLAYMPGIGKVNAAITASSIRATFKNINLALVVGICGGAPSTPEGQAIYQGDIIVSTKILQADFGRELTDEFVMKGPDEGNLGPAGKQIQSFLAKLRAPLVSAQLREQTWKNAQVLIADSKLNVPHTEEEVLFRSDYIHEHRITNNGQTRSMGHTTNSATCNETGASTCFELECSATNVIRYRSRAVMAGPEIFFGAISSTDTVKRNAISRDHFAHKYNVLAFETEGAGAWDILPTIVVKAVCDYADSHKHKEWQPYAAMTAAAACVAILDEWQTSYTRSDLHAVSMLSTDSGAKTLAEKYLNSLDFPQLDSRSASVEPAYPLTCDWIFETPQFSSWLDSKDAVDHNRIFWIKGKPGIGKSTLVKHIHQSTQHFLLLEHVVAAFYFHARGEELQKSRLGMLKAILYQLLNSNPYLLQRFMTAFPQRRGVDIEHRIWSYEELQNFLLLSAQQGWLGPIVMFVDALDECTEFEARELVTFCENLAMNAVVYQNPIYLCLSSRHYPNIGLSKGLQLNIDSEQGHKDALQQYITQRLHFCDRSIVVEASNRARSIFLWAKLVTSMLNTAYDRGVDSDGIRTQLDKMPVELYSIYEAMFSNQDSIEKPRTMLLLQLVLYAAEPLSPRALYLLMIAGTNPHRLCSWGNCGMNDKTVVLQIFTISRGLAEIVQSDDGPIVQFIHETVRGFLLKFCGKNGEHSTISSSLDRHAAILRCCLASMSSMFPWDYPQDFLKLRDFPHIEYALRYVLGHLSPLLDTKQSEALLKEYCCCVSRYLWFYLRGRQKHLGGSSALRAVLMSDHCQHEKILAAILAKAELLLPEYERPPQDYYSHALLAAAEQGFVKCIRVLLKAGADLYMPIGENENTLEAVMRLLSLNDPGRPGRAEPSQITLEIDEHSSDITLHGLEEFVWSNIPTRQNAKVSWLSTHAFEVLFDAFLESTVSFKPNLLDLLLLMAARVSSPSCLEKVLQAAVDVKIDINTGLALLSIVRAISYIGSDQSTTTQWEMITMLLNHHADPESCDESDIPVIFYAIILRHLPLVDLLLQHGANPRRVIRGVSTMHLAAFVGFVDCFKKLLLVGVDINAKDQSDRTPLYMTMGRSSQIAPDYILSWWTPGFSTESLCRRPRIDYPQLASLRKLQERLIPSMIKLIKLGADIYMQESEASQKNSHPRFVAWNKNIGAVQRLLENKVHAASTQLHSVANPYYAAISAGELISLLLGIGDHVRPGKGRNYDPLKRSLEGLLREDDAVDREAALCVLKMIKEMSHAPYVSSLQETVVISGQFVAPAWKTMIQEFNMNRPAVEPRAIQTFTVLP